MPARPTWTITVRNQDNNEAPVTVTIAANSALQALAAAVEKLIAAPHQLEAAGKQISAASVMLDAEWPSCVTVESLPSIPAGERFHIKCRCGANWGQHDRRRALWILNDAVARCHGPGLCEDRWPENRAPVVVPENTVGAEIRKLRLTAGLTQAQLAERAGVSTATVSNAERTAGAVSSEMATRLRGLLDKISA